jgi:hypothetical protein
MALFLVTRKRAYDMRDLIFHGSLVFPPEFGAKVPEAIDDAEQATRCIAFELPTAAGFHLHRVNERVLRRWYDAVTNQAERPQGRTIGAFLQSLESRKAGSEAVRSALKSLKDLHRNPLMHPEDSLTSIDDALALMGHIMAVVVMMLKDIPAPITNGNVAATSATA